MEYSSQVQSTQTQSIGQILLLISPIVSIVILVLVVLGATSPLQIALGLGLLILVLGITLFVFTSSVIIVKEGTVAVIEERGRFKRIAKAGRNFVFYPEKVGTIVSLAEQPLETSELTVFVGGGIPIRVRLVGRFRIIDADSTDASLTRAVKRAHYRVTNWQNEALNQAIAAAHSVLGELRLRNDILGVSTGDEQAREDPRTFVNEQVRSILNRKVDQFGLEFTELSVILVHVPEGVIESIRAEGRAQREARIRQINAESLRDETMEKMKVLTEAQKEGLSPSDVTTLQAIDAFRAYIDALKAMANSPSTKMLLPYPGLMSSPGDLVKLFNEMGSTNPGSHTKGSSQTKGSD